MPPSERDVFLACQQTELGPIPFAIRESQRNDEIRQPILHLLRFLAHQWRQKRMRFDGAIQTGERRLRQTTFHHVIKDRQNVRWERGRRQLVHVGMHD